MTETSSATTNTVTHKRLRLRKACKLRHLAMVNHVFASGGRKEVAYPVRMVWRFIPQEMLRKFFHDNNPPHFGPVQFLITIPKKQVRHAVDRVLMRRRLREAIRLHRQMLDDVTPAPGEGVLALAFIYMANKTKSYASAEKAVCKLLERVAEALATPSEDNKNNRTGEKG